ncbi:HAD family hydrolase [Pseudanabaena sp. FACHB-2040]|uniref:HAD family hydrolase n=1 Tax=Pseudanabaena sp. FACHB-2040 TaxID=2692859 RepID=UPI00168959CC|nr:HAD family hydrolase [Pseudanabaena sp. FACHB-2040]MBD2258045.1 haloacid dehalogenase-like hydrolase [Pseudanabaena sp. FACHB-2040]
MSLNTPSTAKTTRSTKPVCNRIAIVFDFDDTLAPDTFDALIESLELDVETFRQERYQPLLDAGWDSTLARGYALLQESQRRQPNQRITRDYLVQLGKQFQPFDGLEEMFDRLHQIVRDLNPKIDLEFYVISGGIEEIACHTSIAHNFKRIWGCQFHYDDRGEIDFLKRVISHTEKARYLMQIASGQESVEGNGRSFAYRDMPEDQLHVPLSQMIYVGDGASDVPCFSVINDEGGISLGVYKDAQTWDDEIQVSESQRVANLAEADYRADSELMRSLTLALESLCKQITLRQLSLDE